MKSPEYRSFLLFEIASNVFWYFAIFNGFRIQWFYKWSKLVLTYFSYAWGMRILLMYQFILFIYEFMFWTLMFEYTLQVPTLLIIITHRYLVWISWDLPTSYMMILPFFQMKEFSFCFKRLIGTTSLSRCIRLET